MPGFRMPRRFFERIAALCTRLPIAVVAQMAKLSWATVAKVDARAIELGLGDRALDLTKLRWIGVDEVSWTGGRRYFTRRDRSGERAGGVDRRRQGASGVAAVPAGAGGEGAAQDPWGGERPRLPVDHRPPAAARRSRPGSFPHRPV